jgi:hypothetical protein
MNPQAGGYRGDASVGKELRFLLTSRKKFDTLRKFA